MGLAELVEQSRRNQDDAWDMISLTPAADDSSHRDCDPGALADVGNRVMAVIIYG